MQILINIPEEAYSQLVKDYVQCELYGDIYKEAIKNGIILPKGHGKLKDEDEIIRCIENRVNFLKENDALFIRMRKDIDILGCIPKIRHEVPTIIEADNG